MALPSEAELARLFDDAELAREAHAAEVLISWPSLRVLSALCEAGEASTGELARAVNMDMGEVRDHLDALAELGVVAESGGEWEAVAEEVQLNVELGGELRVSHVVGEKVEEVGGEEPDAGEEEPGGLLARMKGWLPGG
jgi:DNA-binding transcriptional ArsR family regulator